MGKVERSWLYRVLWFLLLTENRDQGESVRALSRLFCFHVFDYVGYRRGLNENIYFLVDPLMGWLAPSDLSHRCTC